MMKRSFELVSSWRRAWTVSATCLAVIGIMRFPLMAQQDRPAAAPPSGTAQGEWRYYGGDAGSTKYSPLDQINRDNVKNLKIAWRWKTDNFGPKPEYIYEATPLMVHGVLYTTAGQRRAVAAIDAATGETLWTHRMDEG